MLHNFEKNRRPKIKEESKNEQRFLSKKNEQYITKKNLLGSNNNNKNALLIASAKSQSAREASHQSVFMGSC